jgi:hypothetical protein
VAAIYGSEMDLMKSGREDVKFVELACDKTYPGDSSDGGKYSDISTKDTAALGLRLKLCDGGLVFVYEYFLCHCSLFLKIFFFYFRIL